MFPQCHLPAVRQGIAAERLVGFCQRDKRVVTVSFLYPLHALHGIGQHDIDSLDEVLILRPFIIGVICILLRKAVIVIDKVDGA